MQLPECFLNSCNSTKKQKTCANVTLRNKKKEKLFYEEVWLRGCGVNRSAGDREPRSIKKNRCRHNNAAPLKGKLNPNHKPHGGTTSVGRCYKRVHPPRAHLHFLVRSSLGSTGSPAFLMPWCQFCVRKEKKKKVWRDLMRAHKNTRDTRQHLQPLPGRLQGRSRVECAQEILFGEF